MNRAKVQHSALVIVLAGLLLAGCGGARGTEERTLVLTFVPSAQLNWDGDNANTLQVGVFVLSSAVAFEQGAVTAILDPEDDPDYTRQFTLDRIEYRIFTVRPGTEQEERLVYTVGPNHPDEPQLGVIADYYDPAENATMRKVIQLDGDKEEEIEIILGKDRLETVRRE